MISNPNNTLNHSLERQISCYSFSATDDLDLSSLCDEYSVVPLDTALDNLISAMHSMNDVADMTNLLSISLAIENARIGESNRALGSVTDRIRHRATCTATMATDLWQVVSDIQNSLIPSTRATGVPDINRSNKKAAHDPNRRSDITNRDTLRSLLKAVVTITGVIIEHSKASQEMANEIRDITASMA